MNREHESIIISTDRKNELVLSLVLFLILTALKGFIIGLWIGSKMTGCKK